MKYLALGSLGIILASFWSFSASAQTQEQIDEAARILGRPQTKTSALSFWAGVAEGEGKYEDANKFYIQMQALYELDFGPLNGRVAWMLAKQALCLSKLGDRQKAASLVSKAQEMIASRFGASEGAERKYFESARQILTSPDLAVAEATLATQAEGGEGQKAAVRPITSLDQKQVAAGINAAQTNSVEVLSGGLRTFQFGKHRFVLDTLKGDRLQVNEREKFISVNIMGPERPGKGARVFNISIISAPQMDTASMKSELLAGMLLPYRQRLSDFKEEKISVTLADGRVESGVEYSGSYAGTVSARGFFVLVPLAGTVYVLQGTDRAEFYNESLSLIKELVKSLKIES